MVALPVLVADVDRIVEWATVHPVFPCTRDKRPLTRNGFYDATSDEATIRRWWKDHPDALVGVPTGRTTGLVVIDFDPDKADSAAHEWISAHTATLTGTRTHTTARGGKHWVFQSVADEYSSGKDVFLDGRQRRGIDIRADGGYVIWWPLHGGTVVGEDAEPLPPNFLTDRRRQIPADRSLPKPARGLLAHAREWAHERGRVVAALPFVDPNDRDVWVRVGLALHLASGGHDDGFAVWHAWSAGGLAGDVPASYVSERDCRYHWQSFGKHANGKERMVTLGTLFAYAKAGGWERETTPELPADDRAAPIETYTDDDIPPDLDGPEWSESEAPKAATPVVYIDWASLATQEPPAREWAIEGWLGRGHVTLLAGPPGAGKTAVCQSIASALRLGRQIIDNVPRPMRVLFWAGEDDADEIWRRQVAIARWLGEPLSAFADGLYIDACPDRDITLAGLVDGVLVETPMLKLLREQIGDLRIDAVFLDSVARTYGGNENDRHQVTKYMAMLTSALAPTRAAGCLLGHPAKAMGSEFSGSTAWEASVRARLYFGYRPPGEKADEDEPVDDDQRWLAKRKTNYSQKDIREVRFKDGCMQPAAAFDGEQRAARSTEFLIDEAVRVARRLRGMGLNPGASPSRNYLPTLAKAHRLLDGGLTERDIKTGLSEALKAGRLRVGETGQKANRVPKIGLIES